jgi:hypothetical protein
MREDQAETIHSDLMYVGQTLAMIRHELKGLREATERLRPQ